MSDDFFDQIGKSVEEQAARRERATVAAGSSRDFQGNVVDGLSAVAEDYVVKLKQKGITADFKKYALGLSFTMRWQDGGHWSLDLGPSRDANGLQFHSDFTSDDGRKARTTDGATYTEETWSDDLFEQRLQKAIADYVFYADRHGGVR